MPFARRLTSIQDQSALPWIVYTRRGLSVVQSAPEIEGLERCPWLKEDGKCLSQFFRQHTALVKRAFQDFSSEELQQLELILKKIGKRAESLTERSRVVTSTIA
jgi:hypothetical protein